MCPLSRSPLEFLIFLVLLKEEPQTLVLFFVYCKKNFSWCLTTYASYKTKKYFLHRIYSRYLPTDRYSTEQRSWAIFHYTFLVKYVIVIIANSKNVLLKSELHFVSISTFILHLSPSFSSPRNKTECLSSGKLMARFHVRKC